MLYSSRVHVYLRMYMYVFMCSCTETDIINAFPQRLVYYILNQDRETALSDALEVVKAYSHINDDSVYLFRLPYLIDHDRVSNIL